MLKAWSISTTVRNPDRLRNFLLSLEPLVGKKWDVENQKNYQKLLIKNRLYGYSSQQFYNGLPEHIVDTINDVDTIIDSSTIEDILKIKNYKDFAMRGRQSLNPLTKLGFVVIDSGIIKITPLGQKFISSKQDPGDVFLKSFIKWQLPNPINDDYPKDDGYDVVPFVATLKLINEVNKIVVKRGEKPTGLQLREFSLFGPTLVNYSLVENYAKKVIELRDLQKGKSLQLRKSARDKFRYEFAYSFLKLSESTFSELSRDTILSKLTSKESRKIIKSYNLEYDKTDDKKKLEGVLKDVNIYKLLNNLKDYGDNAIRYFRLTKFIRIRGNGFYVDLEPSRHIEIEALISEKLYKSNNFSSTNEYLKYIIDDSKPRLPWHTKDKLLSILGEVHEEVSKLRSEIGLSVQHLENREPRTEVELIEYINSLRIVRKELQERDNHIKSQPIESVSMYIGQLENIYDYENRALLLEYLSTMGLHALNDAKEIHPNYPVGDDNMPTSTAPGGMADIECFYENFNMICEVTMLKGRDQWFNEGQPVMRHLRDFENKNSNSYCIFIAPSIHPDCAETFWVANTVGYKGQKQKIAPITIKQFVEILNTLKKMRESNRKFTNNKLQNLIIDIAYSANTIKDSDDWSVNTGKIIKKWSSDLLIN